jgi:hypothetical protein
MEEGRILIRSIPGVFDNVVYLYVKDFLDEEDHIDPRKYDQKARIIRELINNKMGYVFLSPYNWRVLSDPDFDELSEYLLQLIRMQEEDSYVYSPYLSKCLTCNRSNDLFFSIL